MSALNMKIGVLGGGQLGRMLVEAASPLGIDISVMDAETNFPAAYVCPQYYKGDFTNYDDVVSFGQEMDIVTVEIENVNIEALKYLLKSGVKVYPQPSVLDIIIDKGVQKKFYIDHEIPTAATIFVNKVEDIKAKIAANELPFPFVQKIRIGGYDGRGVQVIRSENDLDKLLEGPSIIEEMVSIRREVAVIVARSVSGECKSFPVVEMQFHETANLVEFLFCPSNLSHQKQEEAMQIARSIAEKLKIVGLLAVEMFEDSAGNIIVNECAPRPHNSGHHTIEACFTSQFEQHLRAILNLPLGDTKLILPAVMINLLGEAGYSGVALYEGIEDCLKIDGVYPHIYGKKTTKPFRKMGHVTIMDSKLETSITKARYVQKTLKVKS